MHGFEGFVFDGRVIQHFGGLFEAALALKVYEKGPAFGELLMGDADPDLVLPPTDMQANLPVQPSQAHDYIVAAYNQVDRSNPTRETVHLPGIQKTTKEILGYTALGIRLVNVDTDATCPPSDFLDVEDYINIAAGALCLQRTEETGASAGEQAVAQAMITARELALESLALAAYQ